MSLRDGMHPKGHQVTIEQMQTIAKGLDEAGCPLIEVTHGDGLGGASVNYGFAAASDEQYLRAVIPLMKNAKVSALLLPGIGTVDHLRMAARKSVVSGKSVSVRVDRGGRRIIKKKRASDTTTITTDKI